VLQRLQEYGLSIAIEKSEFARTELNFLGHAISKKGMTPLTDQINFIRTMTRPKTITGMCRTLGIFNYYRKFTRNAAKYLAPLNGVLKGHTKKHDKMTIVWTAELVEAFEEARKAFVKFTLLNFPKE